MNCSNFNLPHVCIYVPPCPPSHNIRQITLFKQHLIIVSDSEQIRTGTQVDSFLPISCCFPSHIGIIGCSVFDSVCDWSHALVSSSMVSTQHKVCAVVTCYCLRLAASILQPQNHSALLTLTFTSDRWPATNTSARSWFLTDVCINQLSDACGDRMHWNVASGSPEWIYHGPHLNGMLGADGCQCH